MSEITPQISVRIQNDSGMEIPPRSIVVVTGIEITTPTELNESVAIHHVTQYSGQKGNILVTGPVTISAASTVNPDYVQTGWWSPNKSYGRAYSDQRIYVAIDQSAPYPLPGEEWGPIENEWYVGPSGQAFYADGVPVFSSSSGSGSSVTWDTSNTNTTRAIFMRGTPFKRNYGMIRSVVTPGTLAAPTTLTFDVWLPDTSYSSSPVPYIVATDPAVLGMTVTNRFCFSVTNSGSMSSGSGSGSGSISVPGEITYDSNAGEWLLTFVGRCATVLTSASCNSSGGIDTTSITITG